MPESNLQLFGGDWTEQKLQVLADYLQAYTTALKNQHHFKKAYVDAFAGTGYRQERENDADPTESIFTELEKEEPQKFRDGSARIALKTVPAFDSFVFIESSPKRVSELESLKVEFPNFASNIEICPGDANVLLQNWCRKTPWSQWRAVVFLDPYGMQVDWATIKAIADTRAIDVWILFPLGIGAGRLLTRDFSRMPTSWRETLNRIFGSDEWAKEFYQQQKDDQLFTEDSDAKTIRTATIESIGKYYHERLKSIFTAVADNPRILVNSTNSPLYQLHFASGNPRGAPIAINIAQHILKKI